MRKIVTFLWMMSLPGMVTAQTVSLVKDINATGNQGSSVGLGGPGNWVQVGSTTFFVASDVDHGFELWKTDGTSGGTVLVKDIFPGFNGSGPQYLTNISGTVYFSADDGVNGRELWKSDGTAGGTVLVKDIAATNASSNPSELVNLSGTLIFSAGDYITGSEIWKSNGTSAGTVAVTDLNTGGDSNPYSLTVGGSFVYFTAYDPTNGYSFWKTNGTTTTLLKGNVSIGSAYGPPYMAYVGTTMFFSANDGTNGNELWKSDGTAVGTVLVTNIVAGSGSSDPIFLVNGSGTLYFLATTAANGTELWKSDGTSGGTVLVRDSWSGSSSGASNYPLTFMGTNLYFNGTDGTNGYELWKSQGTSGTTVMVKDVAGAGIGLNPEFITAVGTTLYFKGSDSNGSELWKSDGTSAGTVLVKDINAGGNSSDVFGIFSTGTLAYFGANNGTNGYELWKSDGSGGGTVMVKDINTANVNAISGVERGVVLNNQYIFAANDGAAGSELWKTDGTLGGTSILKDILSGVSGSNPANLVFNGTSIFFRATTSTSGTELWKTDGTTVGTVLVKDVYAGVSNSSYPSNLVNINGVIYFVGYDADGYELWRSDGTDAGTIKVKDINTSPGASGLELDNNNTNVNQFTNVNGVLYFIANDGTNGRELWKSDGTGPGTVLVKNINPGGGNAFNISGTGYLTNVNGTLFFSANDGTDTELWKSDGTTGGTVEVKDINVGQSSSPSSLVNFGNTLFFAANGSSATELWKSDGTVAGTVLVKDIASPGSSFPTKLTVANNTLFFLANEATNGYELWKSDGTTGGTVLLKDILVGATGQIPGQVQLNEINGTLYFNPFNGSGNYLYKTNGTTVGTIQATSTGASYQPYFFFNPVYVNEKVVFVGASSTVGNELFSVIAEPNTQPISFSSSAITQSSFNVSFTAASTAPDGYIAIRKIGSSPTGTPLDGPAYTVGNSLGDGTIVYIGSSPSFSQSGLTANTNYFYDIFAYNFDGVAYVYRPYSPLEGSVNTLYAAPTAQPTALAFSSITTTSFSVGFTLSTPAADGYLAIRRTSSSPTGVPVPGVSYNVNDALGDGTVVFVGSAGLPFNQTGLSAGTQYFYDVYAYNGSGSLINYLTTGPLEGSQFTFSAEPTLQATAVSFSALGSGSYTVGWTNGNGSERLVVGRATSAVSFTPTDGTPYTGNTNFSTATDQGSGNKIVYRGNGNSVPVTNLTAGTVYHFQVFELNGSGQSSNYFSSAATGNPGSRTTLANEPAAQPTGLGFTLHTTSGVRLNFTGAAGSPTGYLIIRKAGSTSTGIPVDGTTYTVGGSLDGTIIAIGSSTQVDDSGLAAGTGYHYTIFSFNGSGSAINYLTSPAGATSSTITKPVAPTLQEATSIGQFSFTANWSTVTGASNYKLDVSADNFSTLLPGYNPKTVTVNSGDIAGLNAGTTYQYRVRAVNANGLESDNSNPTGMQLTVPPTPSGFVFSVAEQDNFTVNWTSSLSATQYLIYVSENSSFSPTLSGYGPKTIATNSEAVTGLTPGNTYFVKVKSRNSGGGPDSPESTPVSKQLKPATPVAIDATNIISSSFKAKWNAANGASSYVIDVSLNSDFSSHVGVYPKDVGNILEETVSGLQSTTTYHYRIYATNVTGDSPNSNPVQVTTNDGGGNGIVIGNPSFENLSSGQNEVDITVSVTGGSGTKTVELFHRKITSTSGYESVTMTNPGGGNTYQVELQSSDDFDEMGAEFFIRASDQSANPPVDSDDSYFIYRSFTDQAAQSIPSIVRSGGTQKSYQIISIPFKLSSNKIEDIFEPVPELGAYDKTRWRLVRYQNGANTDYKAGISTIELGKSYWFNSIEEVSVKPPAGTSPDYYQGKDFVMELEPGWNQIATPYPFGINWSAVKDGNGDPGTVGDYKIFVPEELAFTESDFLYPYQGGFVFVSGSDIALNIPVTLKNSFGGRKSKDELSSNIDAEKWTLPFTLVQGEIKNREGGIGMHPQASTSKDRWDDVTMPRFIQYLETNFYHDEFFWPKFSKDIVPTIEEHEWILSIESNGQGSIELQWDAQSITNAQSNLFLYDEAEGRLIDMKVQASFTIPERSRKDLKIIYTHKGEYIPNHTMLGNAWPNPSSTEVNIPIVLSGTALTYNVEVDVYDLKGVKQKSVGVGEYNAGVHTTQWDIKDANGNDVTSGVYIVKLKVNGRYLSEFSKVIVNRNR